jgi:hypothetical protein
VLAAQPPTPVGLPVEARTFSQDVQEDLLLRASLLTVPTEPKEYGRWWTGEDGRWLYTRIEERIGKPLVLWVGRVYGPRYESLDVANSAVDVLGKPAVLLSVQGADDQWAYLAVVLKRELITQVGGYFREEELTEQDSHFATLVKEESSLTPVVDAVQLTADCLKAHTPTEFLPHLEELVFYFAEHGHANLSRLHSSAARAPELLTRGIPAKQIRAIANAVLGSRPNHGETSILGGFIQDSEWDPATSVLHARALSKYAQRMTHSVRRPQRPMEMAA